MNPMTMTIHIQLGTTTTVMATTATILIQTSSSLCSSWHLAELWRSCCTTVRKGKDGKRKRGDDSKSNYSS
jgi:hypothetical protein